MTLLHALLLGIIQGLTEFIPVSSTAHLLIVQYLLGLPADDFAFAFSVLVQLGTLLALVVYFWRDWLALIKAFFAPPFSTPENRLAWYIIIATIPALAAGFFLRHAVEALFRTPLVEACIRLFSAAVLLSAAEYFGRRLRRLDGMTWLDALDREVRDDVDVGGLRARRRRFPPPLAGVDRAGALARAARSR